MPTNLILGHAFLEDTLAKVLACKRDLSAFHVLLVTFEPCDNLTESKSLVSLVSARAKKRAFEKAGFAVELTQIRSATPRQQLIEWVAQRYPGFTAICIQHPIPCRFADVVIPPRRQDLEKMGRTEDCQTSLSSAAEAALRLLCSWRGRSVPMAVVGSRGIVGSDVSRELKDSDETVCELDQGDDLKSVRDAEVLVCATGVPGLLRSGLILHRHKIVVDVGFASLDGTFVGDVAKEAYTLPQLITPVPGGIGPMHIAVSLERLVYMALGERVSPWQFHP